MQILPQTAEFLAHRSGATTFTTADLATPQVNIAYGSYYLRYLLDEYGGNSFLALAAYNGGEANVNRWLAEAKADHHTFTVGDIPFPETQAYVRKVLGPPSATTAARTRPSSATARRAGPSPRRVAGLRLVACDSVGSRRRRRATLDGDAEVRARCRVQPGRRPAGRDPLAGRGNRCRRALPDAARRHRHRQDDDDGGDDRGGAEAGARDRAQQDAGRAAVQRVPQLLPPQRGGVLRLLLRLLPARGVRSVQGPLHREGLGDQPGDRPAAPLRHRGAVRPPGRADRGQRVVHLRPGLAADLRREPADAAQGRGHRS